MQCTVRSDTTEVSPLRSSWSSVLPFSRSECRMGSMPEIGVSEYVTHRAPSCTTIFEVLPWVSRHATRIRRVVDTFSELRFSAVDFVLRLGEERFAALADCVLPAGFVVSVDYGASFDALGMAHSAPATPLHKGTLQAGGNV